MRNILIIGAGEAGKMTANEIISHHSIVDKFRITGFLDDDEKKTEVMGFPVLGPIHEAKQIIREKNIEEVIIAIPSASSSTIRRILKEITPTSAKIKIVPGIYEIISGDVSFRQIRDFKPEDLLGREEVGFDTEKLQSYYRDKTVLVTGGGGSIGSEILTQLLKLPVKSIIAYGHGENSIHLLIDKLSSDNRFQYVIGDIRDTQKLHVEIERLKPDILFHAAAHKHVPLMEQFPDEAVKNNVIGSYQVAKAAINGGVSRFIFISTDKAVDPVSIMGATKRIAEKITLSLNQQQTLTKFSVVRFGNVLGSRGSVVNIFRKQIQRGGPVTITHPEMERYWMSIREAARLVIKSAQIDHVPICILDMGKPVKIIDIAKNMIRLAGYEETQIPITYTGIRPGEKITECLHYNNETLLDSEYKKIFLSHDESQPFSAEDIDKLINEMRTAADENRKALIKQLIKKYVPEYGDSNE